MAAWRWRWWAPAWLFLAGASTGAIFVALDPAVDSITYLALRGLGLLLVPLIALYAQARWFVFPGEPRGIGGPLAASLLAGLFVYAFVFAGALILSPTPTMAFFLGPPLGLAGGIVCALALFPRAKRLELRRAFAAPEGTGAPAMTPGALIVRRYEIVRLLAEGGQGRVYEALDRRRGGRVVLKIASRSDAAREMRALQSLKHPNIVELIDIIEAGEAPLLALRFAEGGTLRGALIRRQIASHERALALVDGIIEGLAAAHRAGIVHGDVKPENVLLDANGTPMLADFGAAAMSAAPGRTTREGTPGTLFYLPPERLRGEPPTMASDVYAVGIVAHEILAGKAPLPATLDDFELRMRIMTEGARVALPGDLAALAPLLERCLARSSTDRPRDAEELRTAWASARWALSRPA